MPKKPLEAIEDHFSKVTDPRKDRTKDHKLIDVPRPELYDVVHDRREQNNLADTDPALARSLRASLGRL